MEVFVGNLPDNATADDLRRFFAGYGDCSGFLLLNKRVDGRIARCAYGVIEPEEEARRALRELNEREMKGRPVTVVEHVVRERRRPGRHPWRGAERRRRARPWLMEPLVVEDRRKTDRRLSDRRQGERRVADRRSPAQKPPAGLPGEAGFTDQRVYQRRVGERRGGERRSRERRHRD